MLNNFAPEVSLSLILLIFSDGFLAFISPCIFPMLPVYIIYLSGGEKENKKRLLINTVGFVLGFTTIFVLMGATASAIGMFFQQYQHIISRIAGIILILFGLNYIGIINITFLNQTTEINSNKKNLKFLSSYVFGAAFSLGWTPCVSTFLGAALMLASNSDTIWTGIGLLFVFSLGLSVPFFITTLLWEKLEGALTFVKKHFKVIKIISGSLLILVGIMMLFDLFDYYLRLFN